MLNNIPLETAKRAIIGGLNEFCPELGSRAAEILTDSVRANIHIVDNGKGQMMACRPAGITLQDLQDLGIYTSPEQHAELFDNERFPQTNTDNDFAIVDFEYDGTTGSVIYLAHETGHAIADDLQREYGISFRDFIIDNPEDPNNPAPQLEKQAYFVQAIVERHLHEHGASYGIDYQNPDQDRLQSAWREAVSGVANKTFARALALNDPSERLQIVVAALTENTDQDGVVMGRPAPASTFQSGQSGPNS
ncbi:MAG: hypothetical protein AAF988_06425 [Pseudomonadota bacterium]